MATSSPRSVSSIPRRARGLPLRRPAVEHRVRAVLRGGSGAPAIRADRLGPRASSRETTRTRSITTSGSVGDRRYRVSGTIGRECYTSFTVHGPAADGGLAGPLLGDFNHRAFDVAADAATRSCSGRGWRRLRAPSGCALSDRSQLFELPRSAQNDPGVAVCIDIACLDDVGPPPPLSDETLAARMSEGIAQLRQATLGRGCLARGRRCPSCPTCRTTSQRRTASVTVVSRSRARPTSCTRWVAGNWGRTMRS